MSKKKTLFLAQVAVLSALITIMTFVPQIGYIQYGMLSIVIVHIPVIIGACTLGPLAGTILGGVWGVTCLLRAVWVPSVETAIFVNPLISVLPRIIVGLVAGWVFIGIRKLNRSRDGLGVYLITAICATLTNTVLVIGAIVLLGAPLAQMGQMLTTIISVALLLNCSVEIVSAAVLTTTIAPPLKRAISRTTVT